MQTNQFQKSQCFRGGARGLGKRITVLLFSIPYTAMVLTSAAAAEPDSGTTSYVAAAYVSNGLENETQSLMLFPPSGYPVNIPIPEHIATLAFGADGKTLYATVFQRLEKPSPPRFGPFGLSNQLVRIELKPTTVTAVTGTGGFADIRSLAVSPPGDKLFISGRHNEGPVQSCGLFELDLSGGTARTVVDCAHIWSGFQISPGGDRVVAIRNFPLSSGGAGSPPQHSVMEIIEVATGKSEALGDYWRASWSPDGNWIAALQTSSAQHTAVSPEGKPIPVGHSITVLIDAHDISHRRSLGGLNDDEIVWSPDSRYILHGLWRPECKSSGSVSLETIDIVTGNRTPIPSSSCRLPGRQFGWVSSELLQ